jgi:hypothetical protein
VPGRIILACATYSFRIQPESHHTVNSPNLPDYALFSGSIHSRYCSRAYPFPTLFSTCSHGKYISGPFPSRALTTGVGTSGTTVSTAPDRACSAPCQEISVFRVLSTKYCRSNNFSDWMSRSANFVHTLTLTFSLSHRATSANVHPVPPKSRSGPLCSSFHRPRPAFVRVESNFSPAILHTLTSVHYIICLVRAATILPSHRHCTVFDLRERTDSPIGHFSVDDWKNETGARVLRCER